MSYIYYQGQDQGPKPKYQIYFVDYQWRQVPIPIRVDGEEVSKYRSPVVTHYVDTSTGEVIEAAALRNRGDHWPAFHYGESVLLRQAALDSLRKEVLPFALFVLAFRNNRRGVTPPVDDLVKMYADLYGKSPHNVRRYVQPLVDAGVIAGSSVLGPLFQYAGKTTKAKEHASEDVVASTRYMVRRMKQKMKAANQQESLQLSKAA